MPKCKPPNSKQSGKSKSAPKSAPKPKKKKVKPAKSKPNSKRARHRPKGGGFGGGGKSKSPLLDASFLSMDKWNVRFEQPAIPAEFVHDDSLPNLYKRKTRKEAARVRGKAKRAVRISKAAEQSYDTLGGANFAPVGEAEESANIHGHEDLCEICYASKHPEHSCVKCGRATCVKCTKCVCKQDDECSRSLCRYCFDGMKGGMKDGMKDSLPSCCHTAFATYDSCQACYRRKFLFLMPEALNHIHSSRPAKRLSAGMSARARGVIESISIAKNSFEIGMSELQAVGENEMPSGDDGEGEGVGEDKNDGEDTNGEGEVDGEDSADGEGEMSSSSSASDSGEDNGGEGDCENSSSSSSSSSASASASSSASTSASGKSSKKALRLRRLIGAAKRRLRPVGDFVEHYAMRCFGCGNKATTSGEFPVYPSFCKRHGSTLFCADCQLWRPLYCVPGHDGGFPCARDKCVLHTHEAVLSTLRARVGVDLVEVVKQFLDPGSGVL